MGKDDVMNAFAKLGGIATIQDIRDNGAPFCDKALRVLYKDGKLGFIDSCLKTKGGRIRLYYTID